MDQNAFNEKYSMLDRARAYHDKIARLLTMYTWSGFVVSIISLIYLAFSLVRVQLNLQQQISVIATGLGAGVALVSVAYSSYWKAKRQTDYSRVTRMRAVKELLSVWSLFEARARQVAGAGKDDAVSPKELLEKLVGKELINFEDIVMITRALQMRNEMIHTVHMLDVESVDSTTSYLLGVASRLNPPLRRNEKALPPRTRMPRRSKSPAK